MLLGAFRPPKPDNRICCDTHSKMLASSWFLASGKNERPASVVEKLRAAWVHKAPPGSFDSAPPSAVSRDQSVRRSAQDDDFAGVLAKNIADKLALMGRSPHDSHWLNPRKSRFGQQKHSTGSTRSCYDTDSSGTGRSSNTPPSTTPDFLYAALDTSAYAAFFTESRTRLIDSTKFHRKSGSVLGYSQPSPFGKLRAGSAGLNFERAVLTQTLQPW
jgi:hypothetical protein